MSVSITSLSTSENNSDPKRWAETIIMRPLRSKVVTGDLCGMEAGGGGGAPLGSTPLPTCLRVVYFTKCVCYLGDGKFIATLWAACQPYIRCRRWAVVVGWVYRVPTEGDRLLYLGRLDI